MYILQAFMNFVTLEMYMYVGSLIGWAKVII